MLVLRVPAIEPAARNPTRPSSAVSVSTTTTPVTGLRRTSAPPLPFRIFSSSIAPSPFLLLYVTEDELGFGAPRPALAGRARKRRVRAVDRLGFGEGLVTEQTVSTPI